MSDGDDVEFDGVLKWKRVVAIPYEPTRLAERLKASEDESVTQFTGCAPSSNNIETRTRHSKSKLNVFVLFWSSVVLQTFAAATYASAHIHNRARWNELTVADFKPFLAISFVNYLVHHDAWKLIGCGLWYSRCEIKVAHANHIHSSTITLGWIRWVIYGITDEKTLAISQRSSLSHGRKASSFTW